MINIRDKETYILYLGLRGHKQDRNLELRLCARMAPLCHKLHRLTCDHCPDLVPCLSFWDEHVVNAKGHKGIIADLLIKWREAVLHDKA